jgi:fumarate hydratase class II
VLADSALAGFKVNEARVAEALNRNPILVTALNPIIGYEAGAKIAKEAYASGRPIKDVAAEHTQLSPEELAKHLDPRELTKAGGKAEGGGG